MDRFDTMTLDEVIAEARRLDALINTPHTKDFLAAVQLEAAHQIERWGTAHDRAKAPADWFWLLGFLAGKALRAHVEGDREKARHHTISSAAALANWHAAIAGHDHRMQPGSAEIQHAVEQALGESICR